MERQRAAQLQVAGTGFLALFSIVAIALYGLPLYYGFMVTEFGWSREQVTSGNAYSKWIVGPPVASGVPRPRRRSALAHHRRAGGSGISSRCKVQARQVTHPTDPKPLPKALAGVEWLPNA